MRVFLAGATGFVGSHVLAALLSRGHAVTCLVRPEGLASRTGSIPSIERLIRSGDVRVVAGRWTEPDSWLGEVAGHEAVVNAVGIIREAAGSTFEPVHTTAAIALFQEAARCGVRKIVQLSALGADERARSRFHRSKRAADLALAHLKVPYVVLRPSFVYGQGSRSMALFTRLATLPLTPVPGDGCYLVQPVHVADVVRAVTVALERADPRDRTVDFGGGRVLTFGELLDVLACRQGRPAGARKVQIPWPLMSVVAALTDVLSGRGPITRDELLMLRRGSYTSNDEFIRLFGFSPAPFPQDPADAVEVE